MPPHYVREHRGALVPPAYTLVFVLRAPPFTFAVCKSAEDMIEKLEILEKIGIQPLILLSGHRQDSSCPCTKPAMNETPCIF